MVKYATDKQLPLQITMFDSNKSRGGILFKNEVDDWANTNKNLKIVYTISEDQQEQSLPVANAWRGEYGRIDKAMILRHVDYGTINNSIFYVCGSPCMLKTKGSMLQEDMGIPKERIRVEEFRG